MRFNGAENLSSQGFWTIPKYKIKNLAENSLSGGFNKQSRLKSNECFQSINYLFIVNNIVTSLLSPFKSEHRKYEAVMSIRSFQHIHTTQDVKLQLVLRERTHKSGLQKGGPLPLKNPLTSYVTLKI